MTRRNALLALAVVSLFTSAAAAQSSPARVTSFTPPSFPYTPPEAPHRHSSTVAEGYLRGTGVVIQAQANYRLQDAQAQILVEQAESLNYDNYLKRTATAIMRKQMIHDYQQYKRSRELARRERGQKMMDERDQQLARDYQLTSYEFDWQSGTIYWPAWVAGPRYAEFREKLDLLLGYVVRYDVPTDSFHGDQIARVVADFREQLREDFRQDTNKENPTVREEYYAMQRFLVGLKYTPVLLEDMASGESIAMR